MRKLLFGIVALIAVLIAVALFLPQLIPAETFKGELEKRASESLGRNVTIGDDLSIKIFPKTAFRVTDLQIDNPDGFSSPYLVRVGEASIGVDLLKILSREVQINQFVLQEPDINLEKTKSGAINWELSPANGDAQSSSSGDGGADVTNAINDIRLGDVRIVDGKATYADRQADQSYAINDIDVDVTLDSLEKPFAVKGTMDIQDTPSRIDLVMTNLGNFIREEDTNLTFTMELGETSAGGNLGVTFDKGMSFQGPVNFSAPDLPALAALAGSPLPDAPGFDTFSVSGTLNGTSSDIRLTGAQINFDAIEASGDLRLILSGARPKATGTLTTPSLDLRPYMPPPTTTSEGFPAWSQEPMDFTSLRNIDADLDISTNEILLNQMRFSESELDLVISNGRMTAEIPKMGMYKGNGSGRVVVNARSRVPSFAGNFTMARVDAQPFSIDVLSIDNLLGLGGFNFNFTASGASQAAIMATLDGGGGFDVNDGAIKGFNIAKLARAASSFQQGVNPTAVTSAISAASGGDEVTDFSSFLSKFTMDNGIMTVPTIDLTSPVLSMAGSGTIDLPRQTIDLSLQPTASLNADGSGGNGIAVPVRITGTFSNPKVGVDVEALLRGEAGRRLRGVVDGALGDRIKDSPAGGLLDGVLDRATGGGSSGGSSGGQVTADGADAAEEDVDPVEAAAKSAIGSIFGGRKKDKDDSDQD